MPGEVLLVHLVCAPHVSAFERVVLGAFVEADKLGVIFEGSLTRKALLLGGLCWGPWAIGTVCRNFSFVTYC